MKKTLCLTLLLAALLALFAGAALADGIVMPWSGSGTEADPYIISTAADLVAMREYVAAEGFPEGMAFRLDADIDLGEYCGLLRGSWTPISIAGPLNGTFDGGGHTISGLYIYRPTEDCKGLFSITGTGSLGTIKNLTVEGEVTGGSRVGGIIGRLNCEMVNCAFHGTVVGARLVGGLAGYSTGEIDNCRFIGTVTGSGDQIGGIAGFSGVYAVRNCTLQSGGLVIGNELVGGIVGYNVESLVENCESHGAVGGDKHIGGIVGGAVGPVQECQNYGQVGGVHYVGGIAGSTFSGPNQSGTVDHCQNHGSIQAYGDSEYHGQIVGGIAGMAQAPVSNCVNLGAVEGVYYIGGIVGDLESDLISCKSDVDIQGRDYFGKIAGVKYGSRATLTLRSNDSAGDVVVSIVRNIPACPFTYSAGEFYGWNTAADGSGTYYFEGNRPKASAVLDLYAILMNGSIDTSYRSPLEGEAVDVRATVLRDGTYHLAGGWFAVPYDIELSERLMFTGNANLILCNGAHLDANKGIGVPEGASLTIWGQVGYSQGILNATGAEGCAGIGGGEGQSAGSITINGGVVNATGGDYGAGIGGGDEGAGGTVLIEGGTVTATGKNGSAGIGGGDYASGGSFTINEGSVTAYGSVRSKTGQGSAGIGAGRPKTDGSQSLSGGSVAINGGIVYAFAGGSDANAIGANTQYSTPGSLDIATGMNARASLSDSPVMRGLRRDLCRGAAVVIDRCGNHEFYDYGCYSCGLLMPLQEIFAGNGTGENDPFLIQSAEDWNMLAWLYNEGRLSSAKHWFRLTNDITVTTMLGAEGHPFPAKFDGGGHTLTFNAENTDGTQRVAPFAYVKGVTIRNLHTAGSVTGSADRASGLIGENTGATIVENCQVSMSLSGKSYVSAFCIGDGGGLTLKGCLFDGSLSTGSRSGGFVGWTGGNLTIQDCLFAPDPASASTNCYTFYYDEDGTHPASLINSYWKTAYGTAQGKQAFAVTAGSDMTMDPGTPGTTYDLSGITAYPTGLMYGTTFYAGPGDAVALGLSAASWDGYATSFTADAGTLTSVNGAWTLTMPVHDVTISFQRTPTFATSPAVRLTADDGTDGYPDQGPDKLFDGLDDSKWCCVFDGNNFVQFHSDVPVRPAAYAMTTAADTASYARRNPVSWTLEGSMDGADDSWTTLVTVTNSDHLPAENCVEIFYPLTASGSYQYFRLNVTAVRSEDQLQIAEFKLIGTPVFGTPDFTLPASLTAVEEEAFAGIAASAVDVPASCASICACAFRNCPNLTQIRIPADCELGTDVFAGCEIVYVFGAPGSSAEAYCQSHVNCVFVSIE